jgi:hypothetical protein
VPSPISLILTVPLIVVNKVLESFLSLASHTSRILN